MLEGVKSEFPIEVVWEGGRRYRGGPAGGPSLMLDGDRKESGSPVDSILVALGACSAIDVVDILEKRRTPVTSLRVAIEFSRAPEPPRRVTQADLRFIVATTSEAHHVERAVELSFEKYCSVSASLAPDIDLTWSVELGSPGAEAVAG